MFQSLPFPVHPFHPSIHARRATVRLIPCAAEARDRHLGSQQADAVAADVVPTRRRRLCHDQRRHAGNLRPPDGRRAAPTPLTPLPPCCGPCAEATNYACRIRMSARPAPVANHGTGSPAGRAYSAPASAADRRTNIRRQQLWKKTVVGLTTFEVKNQSMHGNRTSQQRRCGVRTTSTTEAAGI